MRVTRRRFGQFVGVSMTSTLAWEAARAQVLEDGEVDEKTITVLLNTQGGVGIYDDPKRFELLRKAVGNMISVGEDLRKFPLISDEQPLIVFKR